MIGQEQFADIITIGLVVGSLNLPMKGAKSQFHGNNSVMGIFAFPQVTKISGRN